jgi:starch synthase
MLKHYAARWPERISAHLGFTERLEHRLMAGADVYLMPSLYEPCGLAQMRAQRYGAVPLARRVGGLADTVEDGVTGFLFDEYSSEDLLRVARAVMDYYYDEEVWKRLMVSGMSRDFSWEQSGEKYLEVYRRVLADPPFQAH